MSNVMQTRLVVLDTKKKCGRKNMTFPSSINLYELYAGEIKSTGNGSVDSN